MRLSMGALAGLTATLVKYWSHDHHIVMDMLMKQRGDQITGFAMGYGIGLIVLMILGAISVWIVHETDFRKMFWVGLSAPALFAAAIPPLPTDPTVRTAWLDLSFISPASAQDAQDGCVGDASFVRGVKTFFGIPASRSNRFTVVAGSYRDPRTAQAKAKAINEEEPELKARVGRRSCASNYYPVVVGDPSSADEARRTMSRALKLDAVEDAFISPQ